MILKHFLVSYLTKRLGTLDKGPSLGTRDDKESPSATAEERPSIETIDKELLIIGNKKLPLTSGHKRRLPATGDEKKPTLAEEAACCIPSSIALPFLYVPIKKFSEFGNKLFFINLCLYLYLSHTHIALILHLFF